MSTTEQQQALLDEFKNYLEQNQQTTTIPEPVDLATLLTEIAGLKTEVKFESRQFKNTLDTLNEVVTTLKDDNRSLATELARHQEYLAQQNTQVTRELLLEIIDIYDRLYNGLEVLERYRPVDALFKHSRAEDVRFIESFKAGQQMTASRFEQLLQRYQVRRIDCTGKPFDPLTMIAVETEQNPGIGHGIVVQELQSGFLYREQILRLAEVKVNKIPTR